MNQDDGEGRAFPERERGCLRIFHLFKFYCGMGNFVFVGAVSCYI